MDSNTHVLKGPRIGQAHSQGASALAQNDKVLVATRDGSTTATWILVVNPNGGFFGGGHNSKSAQNQPGGISFGPNGSISITLPGGQSISVPGAGSGQAPFAPPSGGQGGNTNRSPFSGSGSRGPAY